MVLFRGRGREVLKGLFDLLDKEFDKSNLDASIADKHNKKTDYYHSNPSKDIRYPYAYIWQSGFEETEETKDDVQLSYTFSVQLYDRSHPIAGSASSGTLSLYEEIHRVIKNHYNELITNTYKVLWVTFDSFNFDKEIDPGAVGWIADGSFNVAVQHF